MLKIKFNCSKCEMKLSAVESASGMETLCPRCNTTLQIPYVPNRASLPDTLKQDISHKDRLPVNKTKKEKPFVEIVEQTKNKNKTKKTNIPTINSKSDVMRQRERIHELEELLEQRREEFTDWVKETERLSLSQQTVFSKKIAALEKNFDEEKNEAQRLRSRLKEQEETVEALQAQLSQARSTSEKIQKELVEKLQHVEQKLKQTEEELSQTKVVQKTLSRKHNDMLGQFKTMLNNYDSEDERPQNSRLVNTT